MEERKDMVGREQEVVSDVSPDRWTMMLSQAEAIVKSGICPPGSTKEKVAIIMLTGRELGLSAMQSLRSLYVVNNKAGLMSDMMAGLVLSRLPGAKINCIETSDKVATFEASRPGRNVIKLSFTIEEAERAGLTSNPSWTKYRKQMLRARAQAGICRLVFPDVVAGLYTPEELRFIKDEPEVINMPQKEPFKPFEATALKKSTIPEDFETKARGLNPKLLQVYLEMLAEGNECSVEEVKKDVVEDWDNFLGLFQAWKEEEEKKRASIDPSEQPMEQQGESEPSPPALKYPKTDEASISDAKQRVLSAKIKGAEITEKFFGETWGKIEKVKDKEFKEVLAWIESQKK